jgi:hypothetical protein
MKENITNRPDLEEALQTKLIEEHVDQPRPEKLKPLVKVDETPFRKGMREKVETVEVSTLKPKG